MMMNGILLRNVGGVEKEMSSNDEVCPTCNQNKGMGSLGKVVADKLGADFIKEISAKIAPVDFEKSINSAFEKVKLEPQVKVVHHGLEELENCPTCKIDLSKKYALRSVLQTQTREKPLPAVARGVPSSTATAGETFHWGA